jgi:peroxiredoxin
MEGPPPTLSSSTDPCETPAVAAGETKDDEVVEEEEKKTAPPPDDEEEDESPPPPKVVAKKKKRAPAPVTTEPVKSDASIPLGSVAHLGFVILAAVAVYSFVSVAKEGEMRRRCTPTCILRPHYAGYERKAPDFSLRDTRGHEVTLQSFRGKVVVLNFWTKTCGPCMEEMPEIADLAKILKPMGDVAVVTISTDDTAQEATDVLKSVLREPEPPFPVLMDPDAKVVKGKFGTSLYPETWIIDKDGIIRARFDGAREWSSATVVELVNQIRGGGYCPVQSQNGKFVGESAKLCEGLSGG